MNDREPAAPGIAATANREVLLAQRLVALADTLVDDFDVVELMESLSETCRELLQVSDAGIMLNDLQGGLRLIASSSEDIAVLEMVQLQEDSGPCLDCARTGEVVRCEDLSAYADRWPKFVEAALDLGFQSLESLPMRLRSESIGAINLLNREPRLLDDDDRMIVQALADVATIGILQHRTRDRATFLAEQLQGALRSRVTIEQAKGLLAQAGGMPIPEAFEALRSYARGTRQKLSSVAEALVRRELSTDALLTAVGLPRH